ncbi:phosphoribosyl-ATP diphosphatase [Candidatus Micrarchaeota archaeon]|nr:phosphoribosyl-ATP diphosphatase [Candidatus Micrarchaeota archaeon]
MKKQLRRKAESGGRSLRSPAAAFGAFKDADFSVLGELSQVIKERKLNPDPKSYTSKIVRNRQKAAKKVMEEAFELVDAKKRKDIVWEAADLLYFVLAYLENRNVPFADVLGELRRRRESEKKGGRYAPIPDRGGCV